jgi:hypothetical protein
MRFSRPVFRPRARTGRIFSALGFDHVPGVDSQLLPRSGFCRGRKSPAPEIFSTPFCALDWLSGRFSFCVSRFLLPSGFLREIFSSARDVQGSQIHRILMKFDEMRPNRSGLNSKIDEFWNVNLIFKKYKKYIKN